jgi:serine/threonine protein kinase
MADVYLVSARGPAGFTKLLVAKELRTELANDDQFIGMFLAEARLAARLQHPDVVQTYEVTRAGSRYFLTMEYLDGQPLHRALLRLNREREVVRLFYLRAIVAALSGLHYAHELTNYDGTPLGIVHRDVSPHNLFVLYSGHVKLVDFGIAKMSGGAMDTQSGVVKGKAAYMSPEQAMAKPTDRRADIYSCGVMLWEALSGRRMWAGFDDVAILGRLLEGNLPRLERGAGDVPKRLGEICERALSFDPDARFASAEEMRSELSDAMNALGMESRVEEMGRLCVSVFEKERADLSHTIRRHMADLADRRFKSLSELSTEPFPRDTTETSGPTLRDAETRAEGMSRSDVGRVPDRLARRPWLAWGAFVVVGAGFLLVLSNVLSGDGAKVAPMASATPEPLQKQPQSAARVSPRCNDPNPPVVELSGEIESDATLSCDKSYLLKFNVFVVPGVTLTIENGTVVRGDNATHAALIVQPGGRLVARGTRERPIVFTSNRPSEERKPGDWGGVVLLGRAPINLIDEHGVRQRGKVEGITATGEYGGDDPNDDSGVLSYVRIEYPGNELGPGNELNGLTMAGVGRGTRIDHVQVRMASDDCFEFFGGTVDAKHLVCQSSGDDGFDWDFGYRGRLQFLVLQYDRAAPPSDNGIEGDNDPDGSPNEPRSSPTIYNATLCGRLHADSKESYGLLVRRGTRAVLGNSIVTGFHAAVDLRDRGTELVVMGSIFADNVVHPVAFPELGQGSASLADDDFGLDEVLAFGREPSNGANLPPGFDCSDASAPRLGPDQPLHAVHLPPNDGFFEAARYVGAVRDATDDWYRDVWTSWAER